MPISFRNGKSHCVSTHGRRNTNQTRSPHHAFETRYHLARAARLARCLIEQLLQIEKMDDVTSTPNWNGHTSADRLIGQNDWKARRMEVGRLILRRLVAHIAAGGTTDLAPSVMENDPALYVNPVHADREKRELFLKLPLVAGLSCDIPGAGDVLQFDDTDSPILIVRQADGSLLAFLNMCTHRGSRLINNDRKTECHATRKIVCPFHGWTFDLTGHLCGVPGKQSFGDLDASHRQLVRVPVSEWHGMVFVQATPQPDELDVDRYLGSFAPELAQLELSRAASLKSSVLQAETNWKLALDTYCEGYHFARLHASTIGLTHYSNVAVFDSFDPHWRIYFPERSLVTLLTRAESEWPELEYGGILFLFPNTVIVTGAVESGAGFVRMFRIFPGSSPGETICRISAYTLADGRAESTVPDTGADLSDAESTVTQEDYQIAVDAYTNLAHAPPGFKLVYGRNEIALQALHRSIARVLGMST
jgi:carnitine monooxygenase subunit